MEWLKSLFVEHSALQAVVVISLISTIGIALGRIRIFGISLGVAFIFFAGILAGHFGLSIDPAMLNYAESFGLIIFVYAPRPPGRPPASSTRCAPTDCACCRRPSP